VNEIINASKLISDKVDTPETTIVSDEVDLRKFTYPVSL
jgi:hypothetical protein